MRVSVPVIETARLRLRGHRADDLDTCFAMWSDEAVTRHIGGKPSTRPQTWQRILTYTGHWALQGFGYWLIEEKESGRFVGEVGFADFKRDMKPSIEGTPELGWALTPSMHGKGYATEAVSAAMDWGKNHFGRASRIVCIIAPENAASIRLAEKLGFKLAERADFAGSSTLLYSRNL